MPSVNQKFHEDEQEVGKSSERDKVMIVSR